MKPHGVRTGDAATEYGRHSLVGKIECTVIGRSGAPRGALLYPRCSREELGGRFLGLMAYLRFERILGDQSMPGKQRSFQTLGARRCGTRGIWRELDCPKPNLQTMQADIHRKDV